MSAPIVIVGGGPSGLFCAYLLLKKGYSVDLYDHSSGLAKKFLIAGNGGLNLTHSEDLNDFSKRYGKDELLFRKLLENFSPRDLREFLQDIGIETFVGTSGRVFPVEMSAGKVLIQWTNALKEHDNFRLFLKHRLIGMTKEKELTFENEVETKIVKTEKVILALGGASWKKTGSDGAWLKWLKNLGVKVEDFLPMNCGFERTWSSYFQENLGRAPIKHVEISFAGRKAKGDLMLTPYGVEGGVIYALSNTIRDHILKEQVAEISIDLLPALSKEVVLERLKKKPKKTSLSNFLRKSLKVDKHTFIFLKEVGTFTHEPESITEALKGLKLKLTGMRPLDEAISTSGGVCFSQLSEAFEVKAIPGLFVAGEMLNYEAPTGGYLLQGCFSSAYVVCQGIIK